MSDTPTAPIPVTLLAGFLGAGKTTLLNRLLRSDSASRFAVLVNDFGDLNVDANLVADQEADVLRLEGGCICCTMQSGLTSAAMYLVGRDTPPEHILIEASGISDPMPIAAGLMAPGLQRHLRLDSVLTVIDAERAPYPDGHDVQELVASQIKSANIVLLNKVDLVEDDKIADLRAWIKEWTPGARILETEHADVPIPVLLDGAVPLPSVHEAHANEDHGDSHEQDADHAHDGGGPHAHEHHDHNSHAHHHDHEASFRRWTYRSEVPFTNLDDVQRMLRGLPDTVLRVKGFVATEETRQERMLLQMAGRRAALTFRGAWPDTPRTALVVLSLSDGPTPEALQTHFDTALAGAASFTAQR